jgi:4-alpha-glucanotransferase
MLQKEGRAPRELPIRIAEEIVARHLYCPSMLCLQCIQDWFAMDMALRAHDVYSERINSPFDSYNQWKFRMSVSLDKLKEYKQFNMKIHTMIERSKRA